MHRTKMERKFFKIIAVMFPSEGLIYRSEKYRVMKIFALVGTKPKDRFIRPNISRV